jgi:hypothetical protein
VAKQPKAPASGNQKKAAAAATTTYHCRPSIEYACPPFSRAMAGFRVGERVHGLCVDRMRMSALQWCSMIYDDERQEQGPPRGMLLDHTQGVLLGPTYAGANPSNRREIQQCSASNTIMHGIATNKTNREHDTKLVHGPGYVCSHHGGAPFDTF